MVTGVGFALVGKKDLPRVFHTCGTQVGRLVGLLQGARARADRFSSNNELRQLQNEFRSGLREIDAVRSELAVSMSSRGVVGKGLGTMVPSANRVRTGGGSNGSSNNNYSNNNQISATATNPGSTLTMPAAAAAVKTFPDEPVRRFIEETGATVSISGCRGRRGMGQTRYWVPFKSRTSSG